MTFLTNTSGYRRDLRRVEYGDERDPAMNVTYSGPPSGPGAAWAWKSASEGDGSMTFTAAEPGRRVAHADALDAQVTERSAWEVQTDALLEQGPEEVGLALEVPIDGALGEAQIGELRRAGGVDENVVGLDITVDDLLLMDKC